MQLQARIWYQVMSWILPVLFFVAIWFFIMRQMQVGSNRAMAFGRSRAKTMGEGQPKVTFNDVAGAEPDTWNASVLPAVPAPFTLNVPSEDILARSEPAVMS